jgi:hypothetical protein
MLLLISFYGDNCGLDVAYDEGIRKLRQAAYCSRRYSLDFFSSDTLTVDANGNVHLSFCDCGHFRENPHYRLRYSLYDKNHWVLARLLRCATALTRL